MRIISKKYRVIVIILGIILSFIIVDFIIGYKQNKFLFQKKALKTRLERLAWYSLQSNIEDVLYTPDNKYRIILKFENPLQDELYIMMPTVRVFIQVGTQWKEVPVKSPSGFDEEGTVIKLVEKKKVEKIVEIDVKNYTELLIPYYMHIWVNSTSFVAFEAEPKDIVEKTEPFYIYLKPYYVKDSEIASRVKFPGNKVPVWIPMPPH